MSPNARRLARYSRFSAAPRSTPAAKPHGRASSVTFSRFAILLLACFTLAAQDAGKIRVIAFGAHPDDCDIRAGGTAALFARLGHAVKFVAVTNGDAGHQSQGGGALAKRRRAEAMESARRLGIEYEVLDNHDGELLPTLEVRKQIIKR